MFFRYWLVALAIFGYSSGLLAQGVLQGLVRLPDSSAAAMAVVKLLAADSATLVRYSRTRLSGEWAIEAVAPGQYVLQVSSLGLETWASRIRVHQTDTQFFDIVLQEHPLTLRLVEISASRIGIIERGDTLIYDLSYYLDSTEHDLKDILNRLPDMSVREDGSIMYKGKRVQLALVEGRDLFGHLHKVMTEGISAQDVKGIQVIRNYATGAEQVAREITDKVAVNVQLTDEARQKLKGDMGLNTDAHRFAEGNLTLYRSRPNWGYSLIARGNNTNQTPISPADFLALLDLEEIASTGRGGKIEGSSFFTAAPDAQQSIGTLGALNIDASPIARWSSQLHIRFMRSNRTAENVLFRLYIQDNAEFSGSRNRYHESTLWQMSLRNDYRGNRVWMKQRLYFASTPAPTRVALNGSLAGTPIISQFFQKTEPLELRAFLEGGIGKDSMHMLIGRIQYQYHGTTDAIRLVSPDKLFGTPDTVLEQQNHARQATLNTEVAVRRLAGIHQLTASMGYAHTSHAIEASTSPQQPPEMWHLNAQMHDASAFASLMLQRQGNFRYMASARASRLQRTFPATPTTSYQYLLGNLKVGIYRDFALLNSLYLTAGYTTSPTPFVHLWRYNRIRDENSLYAERLDSSFVQSEAYANLLFMRTDPGRQYSLMLSHTAALKQNVVLYQTLPNGNYLLYQSLLAPSVTQLNTQMHATHKIKPIHTGVGLRVTHNYENGFASLSEQLVSVRNHFLNLTFSLTFEGWKQVKTSVSHTIQHQRQRFEGQNDAFALSDHRTGAYFSYQNIQWRAHASVSYNHQRLPLSPNQYWLLGFEFERRLTKPPLRLRLIGRNALNLQGNRMIIPDLGANYTGFSSFQTMGGQIMIGASYFF